MTQQMETGRVTMMRMLERRVRMRAQHPGEVGAAGNLVVDNLSFMFYPVLSQQLPRYLLPVICRQETVWQVDRLV